MAKVQIKFGKCTIGGRIFFIFGEIYSILSSAKAMLA
jgi:hypothetical protein